MGGAQPIAKQDTNREHLPFNPMSTQEDKLKAVREELLDTVRSLGSTITEQDKKIAELSETTNCLRMDIRFLKEILSEIVSGSAKQEPQKPVDNFINLSDAERIIKGKGVKYATKQAINSTLMIMGYLVSKSGMYQLTNKGKTCYEKQRRTAAIPCTSLSGHSLRKPWHRPCSGCRRQRNERKTVW